jgi:hypothetical protein
MDRGYVDFARLSTLTQFFAFFVTDGYSGHWARYTQPCPFSGFS